MKKKKKKKNIKKRSKRLIQSIGIVVFATKNHAARVSIIGRPCVTPLPVLSKPPSPWHNTWTRHCDPITSSNHFCSSISSIFSFSSSSSFFFNVLVTLAPMTLLGPVLQPLLVVSYFNVIRGSSHLSNCIQSSIFVPAIRLEVLQITSDSFTNLDYYWTE